jgi:hypothetical protein
MASNNNVVVTLTAKDEASRVIDRLKGSLSMATAAGNILANVITSGLSAAFTGLSNSIKQASDIQLNTIRGAGAFAALTGKSFEAGQGFINKMNQALSETAANLPGTTQGYKDIALGIMDNLIPAFEDANGVLNEGALLEGLTEITTGLGVMGAASNIAAADVNRFTAKFLGGSSMAELKQLLFSEANPDFLSLVEERLAESGKKLEQLTVKERAAILNQVQKDLITPDVIEAASNSVSGQVEGFMSSLFDQQTGQLGLMRDTNLEVEGDQSVMNSLGPALNKVIGPDGILANLSRILNEAGINTDIMGMLVTGLDKLTNFFTKVNEMLKGIKGGEIGSFDIGAMLGQGVNGLIDMITNAIANPQLPSMIINGLGQAFLALSGFLSTINWGGIVYNLVAGFALSFQVLGLAIRTAFLYIRDGVSTLWTSYAQPFVDSIKAKFTEFTAAVKIRFEFIRQAVADKIIEIKSKVVEFVNNIKSVFSSIAGKINSIKSWVQNLNPFGGGGGEAAPAPATTMSGGANNAASGFNYQSLLQAAKTESRLAPAGSNLIVANSSEAILNRSQQMELLRGMGSTRGGNLSIGTIVINTQATDANTISRDIMAQIQYEFNKFSQGYLSTAVV